MKPTREFIPMDDYERELWEYENDENYDPDFEISEEEKAKYQKIAENSVKHREALQAMEEVSKDSDFKYIMEKAQKRGISLKDALREIFHKIATEQRNIELSH